MANLEWSAPASTGVAGDRIDWGTAPRVYQQARGAGLPSASTSYTVGNLPRGRTYYFAVTAYDSAGTESAYSAEASKVLP